MDKKLALAEKGTLKMSLRDVPFYLFSILILNPPSSSSTTSKRRKNICTFYTILEKINPGAGGLGSIGSISSKKTSRSYSCSEIQSWRIFTCPTMQSPSSNSPTFLATYYRKIQSFLRGNP
jgi:hypothetical protein